jgi:predicted esterase
MELVNARDVAQLGSRLLPHVGDLAADPALSPSRSRPPAADVYLLHGADDNVIPAAEAELLAGDLRARGATVHLLETPLITHAAVDRPPQVSEVWDLVRFWGRLLDER